MYFGIYLLGTFSIISKTHGYIKVTKNLHILILYDKEFVH